MQEINDLRKRMGQRLFAFSLSVTPETPKVRIRENLPSGHKRMPKPEAVELCQRVAALRFAARKARYPAASTHPRRYGGFSDLKGIARPLDKGRLLPVGTLEERLLARTTGVFTSYTRGRLRLGAAGGHSLRIVLVRDIEAVGWDVTMTSNRTTYRGKHKGREAAEDHHVVRLSRNWLRTVGRDGDVFLFKGVVLAVERLPAPEGVTLSRRVIATQGKGFYVNVSNEFEARTELTFGPVTWSPERALERLHQKRIETFTNALKGIAA